jgi:hypothetical protein
VTATHDRSADTADRALTVSPIALIHCGPPATWSDREPTERVDSRC